MRVKLETWPDAAAGMPNGEHFNLTAADTVVEVIANPHQMQPPHAHTTSVQGGRANTRLGAQKKKNLGKILVEGFRCKIAILIPPLSGTINLGLCALRDADLHG